MATKTVTCLDEVEPELHISIWQDEWAEYSGTAALLKAEGLIPEGFEWPQAADPKRWEANGFSYWVNRRRPSGHKGPMRSWLELDNWFIRVQVAGLDRQWPVRRGLERKAEELKAEFYRHTAAGSREWHRNFERYYATVTDRKFQAFKAAIPGLIPPKRGRKPKDAHQRAPAQ